MDSTQSRRHFLTTLSAAGAAGIFGCRGSLAEEPPPEVTTIRLAKIPSICIAPQYVAEELLAAEGFIDVRYVELPAAIQHTAMARGEVGVRSLPQGRHHVAAAACACFASSNSVK